jgi:RNA polymerase sigma-70 factor, ECF subfamily
VATDAETMRGTLLTGSFELLRLQRSEDRELPRAQRIPVIASPDSAGAGALSDEELIYLLREEDADALDDLFDRYSRLVYAIALRVLKDAGEAEEIVQESFLYVYRKAQTFEPARGTAKVWIVQVAYSRARDRRTHLSRRGFYSRADIESVGLDGTLLEQGDVERKIGAKLDFDRLQFAFDDLSQVQRQTLQLFYFEEMGLKEISEQLHEPLGNVRHHFYRGLEKLRKSAVVQRLRKIDNGKN